MPGKGGKCCVAGFSHQRSCRNSSRSEGISMHMFPRDEKKRTAWTSFVRKHRPNWNPTATSALCSAHFCASEFTQRLGINVPPAVDRTRSSISCKRFLNSEAVPTVDDHDIALQTFPQTTTPVPTTPQVPEPSKLRAKRRLLREATSSQKRAKVADKTEEKHADDNICIHDHEVEFESTLLIESPSVFPPKESSASNTTEHSHELKKCKEKLKAAQQKFSNYRKTIKRLQLKLKTNANGNDNGSNADEHCKHGRLEESGVDDMCSTNQQEKTDGNVNVDPNELDEYLVETDEMNDIEDLKNDPNWENLDCEVGVDDDMEEDTNTSNEKNRVR